MTATLLAPTQSSAPLSSEPAAGPEIDVTSVTPEAAFMKYVSHAVGIGASDIFLACNAGHFAVQVRHLSVIRTIGALPMELGRKMIAHMKAGAGIDTTEHRRPLDGRWKMELSAGATGAANSRAARRASSDVKNLVDLRSNVMPTLPGEDIAIRVIRRDNRLVGLDALGMTGQQLDIYQSMLENPAGLILISGPTGSGKTATLYASLLRIHADAGGTRKINTIEDPVEFALDGLRQSQVNPQIGLGFAELLRSILRQSPDVIMIGEVRDAETAETAIRAANSGVLVFATLHAPSAPAAIQSMRSLGGNAHFLASSLRGVVAQRLLRTLCPDCRTSFDISDAPHTFEEVGSMLTSDEGKSLFAAPGCAACGMTGYAGRTGVFEVMPINPALRTMIADNRPTTDLREQAIRQGMLEFRQASLLKVARGQSSAEEMFRVLPTETLVNEE